MSDEDERPVPDLTEVQREFGGMNLSVPDHAFWETQPVGQLKPELNKAGEEGPIDDPIAVADVKQEPYKLPDAFEWSSCDLTNYTTKQEVFDLLAANYVEDDDEIFRFKYSP